MTLAPFERRWAATIGGALLPRAALGGLQADLDLGAALAEEAARAPATTAILMRAALWLVWLAPLFRAGRRRTFGALSGGERTALLEDLLESRRYAVRELSMLLKLFVCLRVLGDRRVLTRIGAYDLGPGPVRLLAARPRPEGRP